MYCFLLTLQFCGFFLGLICTVFLVRLKSFVDLKYLILGAIAADIYSAGYFLEMLCKSEETAMLAYAFEYMGLAFIAFFYALFIFRFCGMNKVPNPVWYGIFAFDLTVLLLVFFYRYNHLYYSKISFVEDGLFPHMVTEKGPFFIIFAALEGFLVLASSVLLWRKRKVIEDRTERKKVTLLFAESLIAIVSMTAVITGLLGGYDSSSFCLCVMLIFTTLTATYGRVFDVVGIAREDMFRSIGTGIIVTDPKHIYFDSNEAADRLFPELKKLEPGRDLCVHEQEIFNDPNDYYLEKDDKYYRIKHMPLNNKNRLIGYTVIIADITDLHKQMDEIKHLKDEADAANEAKSVFLANMSHEIRTPLNAIIGMAELTQKEKSEGVIKEYVSQMKSAGEMLLGIVSDVLDLSKAESGKLELIPVEFEFAELMNSIINVTNMRIGDKPIDFYVDIDPGIPKTLYGNDVHIRQIFMNLLGNAEKFTEEGHIKLTVDFKYEGSGVRLYASVEDTGIGIKSENIDELFKAFSQLDVKKNRWKVGSGLGLAIFAKLVTLMNGTYGVESEYGKGSTFRFDIALDVVDKKPFGGEVRRSEFKVPKLSAFSLYNTSLKEFAKQKEETGEKFADYSDKVILVVDDNKVNVKVISAFLKHFNVQIDAAYSGPEAIEMVQKKKYDLIFMDQMMPEMDGIEATMKIRELDIDYCADVPVIACTANVVKGVEEMFLQAGMTDFVPKPIRFENLEAKLSKYLK